MRSGNERRMPIAFEVRNGRQSTYVSYEQVLKDRACGRRITEQAMAELDAWRKAYGRLFERLDFSDWREFTALLDEVRGERPKRSPTHAQVRKDRTYARETFYRALTAIDAWGRMYELVFEHWKHADGIRITKAVDKLLNPEGGRILYVWDANS